MTISLLVLMAIFCNVAAQLSMKYAAIHGVDRFSLVGLLGLGVSAGFYVVSFVLTAKILTTRDLSIISPVMAGAIVALITIGSKIFFGETLSLIKVAGTSLIIVGIILLSK